MSAAWQRFRRLSRPERSLFFCGVLLLPMTVCALRFLHLRRVERLMGFWLKRDTGPATEDAAERWRLADAARRMTEAAARHGAVRGNCLSRSMVLWYLLRQQGLPATVEVGGRKDGRLFEAHAWVELEGRIVNDSEDVRKRFAPFESQANRALTRGK